LIKIIFIQNYINYNLIIMNSAIILAGGIGNRMNGDIPKQFILIKNRMVIEYSINAFLANKKINEIIIVCDEKWIDKIQNKYPEITVVSGGNDRTSSSFNGLKACNDKTENVLIHDSARPLINQKIINECINNLKIYDAAIPILEHCDSIVNIKSMDYIDRNSIRIIQTPQAFKFKKIYKAYKNSNISFPDDFSLLNSYNPKNKYIFFNGYKKNIKITYSEDLMLAENYFNE